MEQQALHPLHLNKLIGEISLWIGKKLIDHLGAAGHKCRCVAGSWAQESVCGGQLGTRVGVWPALAALQ